MSQCTCSSCILADVVERDWYTLPPKADRRVFLLHGGGRAFGEWHSPGSGYLDALIALNLYRFLLGVRYIYRITCSVLLAFTKYQMRFNLHSEGSVFEAKWSTPDRRTRLGWMIAEATNIIRVHVRRAIALILSSEAEVNIFRAQICWILI